MYSAIDLSNFSTSRLERLANDGVSHSVLQKKYGLDTTLATSVCAAIKKLARKLLIETYYYPTTYYPTIK